MRQWPQLTIRGATPADRVAAIQIAADAMRGFGIEPDFAGLDADLAALGSNPNACAELVAIMGDAFAGVIILTRSANAMGKLTGFYVDPQWRGRGIGSALLARAIHAGRSAGLSQLYLQTWHFMTAAIRLYERAGWTRVEDPLPESGSDRAYKLTL
jgi:ribosomal protein S18 acetylase RimI-like enzyme